MNRIAIVTPTVPKRKQWLELQKVFYQGRIHPNYACDDTRNAFDAIRQILPDIDAQYIVFAGDDDFHFLDQLKRQADFLDSHPECVGVYGNGLLVQLEDFEIGWTADYREGMEIERAFSLTRTEVFKRAMAGVPQSPLFGREIMNKQNLVFIAGMERQGPFKKIDGLQTIHCHHAARGELETSEAYFRTLAEKYGGGWLASWLPSRSCSRRNLERRRSPYYEEFSYFRNVVESFNDPEPSGILGHHPV